jgi:hypothetical protein
MKEILQAKIIKYIELLKISNHFCIPFLSCSPLIIAFVKIVAFACRVGPVIVGGYFKNEEQVQDEEFTCQQASMKLTSPNATVHTVLNFAEFYFCPGRYSPVCIYVAGVAWNHHNCIRLSFLIILAPPL